MVHDTGVVILLEEVGDNKDDEDDDDKGNDGGMVVVMVGCWAAAVAEGDGNGPLFYLNFFGTPRVRTRVLNPTS